MRSPRATTQQVCCDTSLCQHPDCWRFDLQRVREAVWRRNGIEPEEPSTARSMAVDQVYLTKEQRLESSDGGLPTLKVVDMFSDLDGRIKSAPDRQLRQPNLHRRSTSLPSLSPDQSQPTGSPQIKMPHPSPVISPSARTEYQRKMLWKKQFSNPSRAETSMSRESGNAVKVATIGVHEVYEPEELCADWEEVYVTSAYLVWCPSNKKKRRKKRKGTSESSRSTIKEPNSNKVTPKDVTEDFVPSALEAKKPVRPKSTKTPTGGQPFSPHKSPVNQPSLRHYGMEDLSDLPKPILSGMLKRITQRSNEATPEHDSSKDPQTASNPAGPPATKTKKLLDGIDLSADFDTLLDNEERASSKVCLAVDINSRFTTPEEDEELEKQKELEKKEKEKQETEAHSTNILDLVKKVEDKTSQSKSSRELLRLNSIGVPIEDLPTPKSHHCMSSIPRRQSLGAALEPVNIVPIEASPINTPRNEPQATQLMKIDDLKTKGSRKVHEFVVDIPHGRASSALERSPYYDEEDRLYVHQSFRNSPSPVRAPAPTPSSPDKYSEFFRQHSRISQAYRPTSLQEDEMLATMRRWNSFSYVSDPDHGLEVPSQDPRAILRRSPVERQIVETDNDQNVSEERVFLTEGFEASAETTIQDRPNTPKKVILIEDMMVLKGPPSDTRGRSPSPGSRTHIPKDIIEEFRGNLYGRQFSKAESKTKHKASKSKEIVLAPKITVSGWRPPRSRTPIQFAETAARFAPRPLKQPPQEMVPRSLHIVPIPTQNVKRPKSTPPRITTPNNDYIAQVLSESSLQNTDTSRQVHGPSTNMSGSGSVPPPPSPEAPVLPNDLNMAVSTLEPLCEEDERSSRTTSIAEFVEKGVGNPRLSPLGGGSEISEESVDLPKELCEDRQGAEGDGHKEVQENKEEFDGVVAINETKSEVEKPNETTGQDSATKDTRQTEEPEGQGKEDEGLNNEENEDEQQQEEKETLDSSKPQATELPQDTDPSELTPPTESEEPRPVAPPESMSPRRGSPEPIPQPPGSPDVTSDQDFTEGVDMDLDLTAQLQAAMEGLDDLDLDDDDDENNDDDNIDSKDEDGDMNIKSEDKVDVEGENSMVIDDGNNKTLDGDKNDDTNDDDDNRTPDDINMDNPNDEDDTNKADGDDTNDDTNDDDDRNKADINMDPPKNEDDTYKVDGDDTNDDTNDDDDRKTANTNMDPPKDYNTYKTDGDNKTTPDINTDDNDHNDNDESKVAQSDLDKVDQEDIYFDRTSPLLEA